MLIEHELFHVGQLWRKYRKRPPELHWTSCPES